jgi:hypothetical protein
MSLTLNKIEQMAPDQASLKAAAGLRKPAKWPLLAQLSDNTLIWGECQGSGSTPYRSVASLTDLGYKCTCPSRKFPCKHVLALLWQYAENAARFETAENSPDWVQDWVARRRPKTTTTESSSAPKPQGGKPGAKSISLSVVDAETAKPRDEKAEARAARQRERLKAQREAAVLAGLDELERWLSDQIANGLAAFAPVASTQCRVAARRLVDAKAPSLAASIDALPSEFFALPETLRDDFLFEKLGTIALLINAYRRTEQLPPALAQDVRRAVGWTMRRDELLADPEATRVKGTWFVAATREEVQPDKLRRLETWLMREPDTEGSTLPDDHRFALLLDFVPVSAGGASFPYAPGERFIAELVFYPSATPMRAMLVERSILSGNGAWPMPPGNLADAYSGYLSTLALNPFLGEWPLTAKDITIEERGAGGIWLNGGDLELRITDKQVEPLLPLSGIKDVQVVGLWNGHLFTVLAANTSLGRWWWKG